MNVYARRIKPRMETVRVSAACAIGSHWRCFGKRLSNRTCECQCPHPMARGRATGAASGRPPVQL